MSEELWNMVRREIQRTIEDRMQGRVGTVSSYDPDRHAVKMLLQPEEIETGWVPIASPHIGNGFGIVVGPGIGDQMTIGYHEGDLNSPYASGRLFSDDDQPPVAQSGELVLQTQAGVVIKADKTGALSITLNNQALTINSGSGQITITGPVAIVGPSLTHNGHDVGSTHEHTGVIPGAGTTGPPV
jgi:phage baseplate assembly protein gpV